MVVRLYASLANHELVLIGQRACPGAESECLGAVDPAITVLADALGRARGDVHVTTEGRIEIVELR